MSYIKTYEMSQSTILRINAQRNIYNINPIYQRNGDIWNLEKRQLLIDSILNDYDIPKLYFHALSDKFRQGDNREYEYAIIDGRQRIETIWKFIDGEFPLSADFKYFKDESIKACGLTYFELAKKYPLLKTLFDSSSLPIICVETDDLDLIEDMFSRLNEAVPLNAAEKRNAFGGPMVRAINNVSNHKLFTSRIAFSNKRYQYKEVAARLLFIEHSLKYSKTIYDTKKIYIDTFVKAYKKDNKMNAGIIESSVVETLDTMIKVFINKDALLRSQSSVPIYYLLFKEANKKDILKKITRNVIADFIEEINENRNKAEIDISTADYSYLEYDRLNQQGTNDASNIKERLEIMSKYIGV